MTDGFAGCWPWHGAEAEGDAVVTGGARAAPDFWTVLSVVQSDRACVTGKPARAAQAHGLPSGRGAAPAAKSPGGSHG